MRTLALLAALSAATAVYLRDDVVSTVVRTQHGGYNSGWADVTRQQMPRFSRDTPGSAPVTFHAALPGSRDPQSPLKVTFAFSDSRFAVPWIVLDDALGRRLLGLTVVFSHADGDIAKVSWRPGAYVTAPLLLLLYHYYYF